MTIPISKIGDKGQSYQAEEMGWQSKNEWKVIGWSDTEDGARKMCAAIYKNPCCLQTRIVDREAPLNGGPNADIIEV